MCSECAALDSLSPVSPELSPDKKLTVAPSLLTLNLTPFTHRLTELLIAHALNTIHGLHSSKHTQSNSTTHSTLVTLTRHSTLDSTSLRTLISDMCVSVNPLTLSLITHSCTHSLTHLLTSLTHSLTHLHTHPLTRTLTHPLAHLHSLIHSLTHSLTHSLAPMIASKCTARQKIA